MKYQFQNRWKLGSNSFLNLLLKFCHIWLPAESVWNFSPRDNRGSYHRVTQGSVDSQFLWDHKGLPFPRSALSTVPGIPRKSDFLECRGTHGKREKPGMEENIGPQENTCKVWEITRRNSLPRAQWKPSRTGLPRGRTNSGSLEAGGGSGGTFLFVTCYYLYVFGNEMS